ncbi:electron transfer flavoprotein subunit beta/FixA family protein [Nocardioides agariphilus]|uniref:Electron transfer flavoprotein subunit beta n=1 Tax=Nocardioides agariphilus TaxID=433664 RepID=A0A930YK19_9ACTN|nr:electron transfer flavoprotein subunit beta/FixA family protein [Nocardioides agariphilus]MBF4769768.1 electron transfer flavoprotein subunit beta/FixA family protein [Nocardioides agariphilus]
MQVVACIKHVPDATADRRFTPERTVDRSVDGLLSELDEYAVEQALRLKDRAPAPDDVVVAVVSMGPARAVEAIRKALQMGADRGVHVIDDALAGSDALATSLVLAAAARWAAGGEVPDLVVCGMASTDAGMGVVPAMLAERLGLPQVTLASLVEVRDGEIRARRDGDHAREVIGATLPAVLSVTDQSGEARYPSFKAIVAAKKKPVDVVSLADLDVDATLVGAAASWSVVDDVAPRPPRSAGVVVRDVDGAGVDALVGFLTSNRFI